MVYMDTRVTVYMVSRDVRDSYSDMGWYVHTVVPRTSELLWITGILGQQVYMVVPGMSELLWSTGIL